jgi:hypothetical protein
MDDNVTNQRRDTGKRESSVNDEVQKLFKRLVNGKISQLEFQNLRNRYGNTEFVDKIERAFLDQHSEVIKKAKKFAQLIREKYNDSNYPFHMLLEKAYKYKTKHNLSNEVFAEFQRIYENELAGNRSTEVIAPSTNVQKVLGSVSVDYQGFAQLNENDYKVLQEMLKLHAGTKAVHSSVVLQSMQYQDLGIEALSGTYNKDLHNVSNHVHPVIAAMFLPKVDVLEQHFLHSNIANIVKTRYNKESFSSMADALLYDSLIRDPLDVVCDTRSTMQDLSNRAHLQVQLWNAVLALRNGQYYNQSFREFIGAIDSCRMNKYDTPDLVYGRFDGTILKRLLSAFSFRPTVVTTTELSLLNTVNPYLQTVKPQVTNIHMMNLKMPFTPNDNSPIDLQSAMDQTQFIIDQNGHPTPRQTTLIYSRGVLFFYVDRRTTIVYNTQAQPSFMIKLPSAVSGFERLNQRQLNFEPVFNIRNDQYKLRSVVVSEVNTLANESDLVVGSSTLLVKPSDPLKGVNTDEFYHYDPYKVVKPDIIGSSVSRQPPITQILGAASGSVSGFIDMARTRGIIFMYELTDDNSAGVITF